MGSDPPPPDPYVIANDCINLLHLRQIDERIGGLYRTLQDAELRGEETTPIQQEILALQREKQGIRHS